MRDMCVCAVWQDTEHHGGIACMSPCVCTIAAARLPVIRNCIAFVSAYGTFLFLDSGKVYKGTRNWAGAQVLVVANVRSRTFHFHHSAHVATPPAYRT